MKRMGLLAVTLAMMLAGIIRAVSSASTSLGFKGNYAPKNWTATGRGIIGISPASGATNSATFSYDLNPEVCHGIATPGSRLLRL